MSDRRQSFRHRTLLEGRIEIPRLDGTLIACTVRNLSTEGARLSLPREALIPETFRLGISDGGPQMARLIWYRAGELGVMVEPASRPEAEDKPRTDAAEASLTPLQARMRAIMARDSRAGG